MIGPDAAALNYVPGNEDLFRHAASTPRFRSLLADTGNALLIRRKRVSKAALWLYQFC